MLISQVRCTGERPSCNRCSRLRRSCTWTGAQESCSSRQDSAAPARTVSTSTERGCKYVGARYGLFLDLVDSYFSNVYNASLLLHRQSFNQSLSQGAATKHVVLSVYALGSWYCATCLSSVRINADQDSDGVVASTMIMTSITQSPGQASPMNGQKKQADLPFLKSSFQPKTT